MFQNLVQSFEIAAEYVGKAASDLVAQGRQEGWLPLDRFTELPTAEWSKSIPVRRNRRYRLEESPDRSSSLDRDIKPLRDTHCERVRSPNGPDFHLYRRSHRYRASLKAATEGPTSGLERGRPSTPTVPPSSPRGADENVPMEKFKPDRGAGPKDLKGTPVSTSVGKTDCPSGKIEGKAVVKTPLASPLTVGTILVRYTSPPRDRGAGLRGSPNRPQEGKSPTSGPEEAEEGDGAAGQESAAGVSGSVGERRHTRSVTRQSGVRPEYEGVGSASSDNEESGDSDADSGEDTPGVAVPAGLSDSSGDEHDAREGEFATAPTDPLGPSTSRAASPVSSGSETEGYSCSVETETVSRASQQSVPTSIGEETETVSNVSQTSPPRSDIDSSSRLVSDPKGTGEVGEDSSSGSVVDESTLPKMMGNRATDFLLSSLPMSLQFDLTGLDSGSDSGRDSEFHVRDRRSFGGQTSATSTGPTGGAEEEMEVDTSPLFRTPRTSTPSAALGHPPTPPEDSAADTGTTSAMEGVEEGAEEEMTEVEGDVPSESSVEGPGTPSPLTPVAVSPPGTPGSPQDRDPSPTGHHVSVGIQVSVSQPGDANSPIVIDSDGDDAGTPQPHGKPDPSATTSPEELLAYARRKSLQSREIALQHSLREEELRRELDRYTASSAQVSVSFLLMSYHLSPS